MKMPVRILLLLLCAVLIAALPFTVSSPNMLNGVKNELMNDDGDEDEIDFGRLLFSAAKAEEETETEVNDDEDLEISETTGDELVSNPEWVLPLDFTPGQKPNEDLYTENTYEDESIRVRLEQQEMEDGTKMFVAYVQISDPSQLRTGVANPEKPQSTRTKTVGTMAKNYNAVIALNGDNYTDKPDKTTFEYRMTKRIRSKSNKQKDILIIDDQGDFHLFGTGRNGHRIRVQSGRARTTGCHRADGDAELCNGYYPDTGQRRKNRHVPGKTSRVYVQSRMRTGI